MEDREAWHAAVHGVAKSWTRLSDWTATNTRACVSLSRIEWLSGNCYWKLLHHTSAWWNFPGGLVVRTLCFYCRGQWLNTWWGAEIWHAPLVWPKKKKLCIVTCDVFFFFFKGDSFLPPGGIVRLTGIYMIIFVSTFVMWRDFCYKLSKVSQLLQEPSPLRFLSLTEFSSLSSFFCESCRTESTQGKKIFYLSTTLPGFSRMLSKYLFLPAVGDRQEWKGLSLLWNLKRELFRS